MNRRGVSVNDSILGRGPRTIYWYVTNTCNQRCAHCWITAGREYGGKAARLSELLRFFDEAVAAGLRNVKLTGGEPMVYRDFRAACEYFSSAGVNIWLETNGILIDDAWAQYFADIDAQVGLSLDDVDPRRHDAFRASPGSFQRTVFGARAMVERGVRVGFTSCLTESNIASLTLMTRFLLEDVGADHVAYNPIMSFGRAREGQGYHWREYLTDILSEYEGLAAEYGYQRVILNMPPAFTTTAIHQRCLLGDDIISVLADGSVSICGFGIDEGSTIRFGDARRDSIVELWQAHGGIIRLRTPGMGRLKGICSNCVFVNSCRGYCRAIALAEYGDVDAPYPVCQHYAEERRFPARYLIDPDRDISYRPSDDSQRRTRELLPTSAPERSGVRPVAIPLRGK